MSDPPISTYVLAFIIGIIYPIFFVLTYKKTHRRMRNDGKYRLIEYKLTMIIFWTLTFLIMMNLLLDESLRQSFFPTFNSIGIVVAVLVAILIGVMLVQPKVKPETALALKKKLEDGFHFLPKNRQELIWFNVLSVSAGICEEIIFRLFMFTFLLESTNLVVAFILQNLVFAITHIGSGIRNIVSVFILGLIFTTIYYFTENIWLAIILHAAIDIYMGFLGYNVEKAMIALKSNSGTNSNQV